MLRVALAFTLFAASVPAAAQERIPPLLSTSAHTAPNHRVAFQQPGVTSLDSSRATWRWPVVGGAVGAVIGGSVYYVAVQQGCDVSTASGGCNPAATSRKAAALGAVVVGSAGALVGATAKWFKNRRRPIAPSTER